MNEDALSQLITRVVTQFGAGRILAIASGVAVVGLIFLSVRRTRILGLVVLGASLIGMWTALLLVTVAMVYSRVDPVLVVGRPYYSPTTRQIAVYGLYLIPALTLLAGVIAWRITLRRRKAKLPAHLKNGLKAFFQKDYDAALREYGTAISIDRTRAESYNRRGQVHFQLGDLPRALADFDRALDLAPELGAAYRFRGMVFAAKDDLDLALSDFDFALKLDPMDCAAMLQRGLCLSRLGRTERSIEELRRVLHMTNHTDYADPAKEELRRLGAID